MTPRYTFAQVLLALAAFLAPLLGGFLQSEPLPPFTLSAGNFFYALTSVEGAQLAHAILGLLIVIALAIALIKKQVVQLPQPRMAVLLSTFGGLLILSTLVSNYKMVSVTSLAEWGIYIFGLLAVVAVSGRESGPKLICGGFVAGCTLLAVLGLRQYIEQADPTWRIFGLWQEPNSLAGMLLLGFFVALGLGFASERLGRPFCLFASALIGCALALTGSKGGLGSALIGLLILFVLIGAHSRARAGARLGHMFLAVLLAAAALVGVQRLQQFAIKAPVKTAEVPQYKYLAQLTETTQSPAPASSLSRVLNPSANGAQSMKFRENLWQSCVVLIKDNPLGYGLGTFTFESARPGLNTQTQLAHESYLQLAVEANPFGAVALVVLLLLCAFEMLRGSRRLPETQNLFRAGIFAALFASAVHNGIDSDFYQMGIGLSYFMLLGVGLQLSTDAVVPELLPRFVRWTEFSVAAFCGVFLVYSAIVQLAIENVWNDIQSSSPDARADAESLQSYAGWDPRVWYATFGLTAHDQAEAEQGLQRSIAFGPEQRTYRLLASLQNHEGHPQNAQNTLKRALRDDPNNLLTLTALLETEKNLPAGNPQNVAQRIVAIENTPYFNIRAIPEIVPTETYAARLYLSQFAKNYSEEIAYIRPAIDGFLVYANMTVPQINKFASIGASPYGRVEDAKSNLELAQKYNKELERAYAGNHDAKGVQWATEAQKTLQSALDGLKN